jgi:hypothetical protein
MPKGVSLRMSLLPRHLSQFIHLLRRRAAEEAAPPHPALAG